MSNYQLLPKLSEEDYQRLRADIAERGIMVPVEVDEDGNILDGHHRMAIAQELGIKCPTIVRRDMAEHDKRIHAVMLNLARRQLTGPQKVLLGRRIEPDIAARAAARRAQAEGQPRGTKSSLPDSCPEENQGKETRDEVAEVVGLGSGRTYERNKKVMDQAEEMAKESPEIAEVLAAAERGEAEMGDVRKALGRAERQKAEERQVAEERDEIDPPIIKSASASDWLASLDEGSADLLITDPPYATDVDDIEDFARHWVPLAMSAVKPTGRAYICTGAYPEELRAYLSVLLEQTGFTVANVLAWHYPDTLGPTPKLDYKSTWQAIFHIRGAEAGPLDSPLMVEQTTVQTFNMNSGITGGRRHAWQKPDGLAERLIRHSTKPGDLVIDPFTGTGTFMMAAARLGRVAKGCDIDPEMLNIAKKRGCHVE
jgi:hypothetical protein